MTERKPATPGVHIVAPQLYSIAVAAYDRMATAPGPTLANIQDGLIAIVFAAASLEGFLAEAVAAADMSLQMAQHEPPEIHRFITLVRDCEEQRAQISLQFQVARLALTGSQFDTGAQPYQDFADLIHLRNQIVHWKGEPARLVGPDALLTAPKALRNLVSRVPVRPPRPQPWQITPPLPEWLDHADIAKWACNSASAMVRAILDAFPTTDLAGNPSFTRDQLLYAFVRPFQHVD